MNIDCYFIFPKIYKNNNPEVKYYSNWNKLDENIDLSNQKNDEKFDNLIKIFRFLMNRKSDESIIIKSFHPENIKIYISTLEEHYSDIFNYYNIYRVIGGDKNNGKNILSFKSSSKPAMLFMSSCGLIGQNLVKANIEIDLYADYCFATFWQYIQRIDREFQLNSTQCICIYLNKKYDSSEHSVFETSLRKYELEKYLLQNSENFEMDVMKKYFLIDNKSYCEKAKIDFVKKFGNIDENYNIYKLNIN
jgi:hypothetical protein